MRWPWVSRRKYEALQEQLKAAVQQADTVLNRCLAEIYKHKDQLAVEQSSFESIYANLRRELENSCKK